jgi:hypothetical protein
VVGCELGYSGDDSEERAAGKWCTRYLLLVIHAPAAARAMTVSEYPVASLAIEVRGPDNALLKTIAWKVNGHSKSYLIRLKQQGEHEIRVTHIGNENGETVEAAESITVDIRFRMVTVIWIAPGAVGMIHVEPEG